MVRLWPVTILSRKFGKYQQVNPQLIAHFEEYRQKHPQPNAPVYVSPDNFAANTEHPALLALQKFIMDNVFEVASDVNGPHWPRNLSLQVHVTGMWFQISNGFGFHETHVHGNCSWSGVYYVQSGNSSRHKDDLGSNGQLNGITRFYGPHTEYQAGGHGEMGNFYLQTMSTTPIPKMASW